MNFGPKFKDVEKFFIANGSDKEEAELFFSTYSSFKWKLPGEEYVGYGDDWKKKAASRLGMLYHPKT